MSHGFVSFVNNSFVFSYMCITFGISIEVRDLVRSHRNWPRIKNKKGEEWENKVEKEYRGGITNTEGLLENPHGKPLNRNLPKTCVCIHTYIHSLNRVTLQ